MSEPERPSVLDATARVLITGCGGMLGEAIHARVRFESSVCATDLHRTEPWLCPLDVRNLHMLRAAAEAYRPTWIFHLAALTDMEYCETHPGEAYRTNAAGTENVSRVCRERNIPMVYISTAGVFDGERETYVEDDRPNPVSVYGKSKYAGELAVQALVPHHFIFRAGWMMGGGPRKDKKFVNKFLTQLRQGVSELRVVDDKLGSPTYSRDFARTMLAVMAVCPGGLYHVAGQGVCSRFALAEEILRHFALETRVTLTRVSSEYWKTEYFAPRPRSEQLINRNLALRGITSMPHWKESLRSYLASHDWQIA